MPVTPTQSIIRESPILELPRDQVTKLDIVVALESGHALADWASFLLTIREDIQYPNRPLADYCIADPIAEGWASTLTAVGSILNSTTLRFTFVAPSGSGVRRYSIDAWGIGGVPGNIPLYQSTWLTVTARTR